MKVWMLGTGSRGNAVLVESGGGRILIDAGFPARVLEERLSRIGVAPESIEAQVLTHEHHDHARGAAVAAARWGWRTWASTGTVRHLSLGDAPVSSFEPGASLTFSTLDVETVPVAHDAAAPVALIATAHSTGARAGIFYDLGCITPWVRRRATDLDILVLEANHDDGMLRAGPYPPLVQARIASRVGHLSNHEAADLACHCVHRGLRQVLLAHVSERCNDPRTAVATVADALRRTAFGGRVDAAGQDAVAGPIVPGAARRAFGAQLTLPF